MRLAVLADIHASDLGSRVNPATGLNARFEDALDVTRWVARDAQARGCDALIVAGDFTEERRPAPWRVKMLAEALGEFDGPFVLVRGNHDQLRAGRSIVDVLGQMLPDAKGFSQPGIAWIGRTAICALPYVDGSWLRAQPGFEAVPDADVYRVLAEQYLTIARGLYAEAKARDGAEGVVLVVHQGLAGGNMSDAQQAFLGDLSLVVDTAALGAIGFDAILAGHFHMSQVLSQHPLIAYAGAPQRVTFGEEAQEKGYLVVDVEPGAATMEFVPTPARRFVTLVAPRPDDAFNVHDAIVRCVDVDPDVDVAQLRAILEADGAFEVVEMRRRPAEAAIAGGIPETLTPHEALSRFFEGDPDAAALVERGHELLVEVAV